MVGSHMHRRFGLFGTETNRGRDHQIVDSSTVSPRFRGSADRVQETSEVVVGVGPPEVTVPAIFAFWTPGSGTPRYPGWGVTSNLKRSERL